MLVNEKFSLDLFHRLTDLKIAIFISLTSGNWALLKKSLIVFQDPFKK